MLVNLNGVLKDAQKGGYAVGLFNTTDTDMLQAVIEAAEEVKSPVIIGTAEILLPYGELKLIAPSLISAAKRATVPVVVHYDHGLTAERCKEALELGFSSVMYDGSVKDYKTNIAETRAIKEIARSFGATVEGEIGHVGNADCHDGADRYTTVEEAVDYMEKTGVDALAIAIGTAHGVYKSKPQLNLKRLAEIRAAVNAPLVLHGGSGLSEDDFKNCIKTGISKVNIFTDLCLAGDIAAENSVKNRVGYLEARNAKVEQIKKAVIEKMKLFGCAGKA